LVASFFRVPHPPPSTLFPYTTLFRSLQVTPPFFYVHVRTSLDVATVGRTIRAVLRSIDAGLATSELGDMQQSISRPAAARRFPRSEEHTSELQSRENLVCRLLLEKKK